MGESGIERILRGMRTKSSGDNVVSNFLVDLLYEEQQHPAWWKETYREKIENYSNKWGESDDN